MDNRTRNRANEIRTEEPQAVLPAPDRAPQSGKHAEAVPSVGGVAAEATAWPERHSRGGELGMATAEYAIATLAAVGFAGLLVVILRSDEVRGFLLGLIRNALSIG